MQQKQHKQKQQQQEDEWMQAFHRMSEKQRKLALAHLKRMAEVKPSPRLTLVSGGKSL